MRTNIEIDDELMAEALETTGLPTKKAVVEAALRALVLERRRCSLLELRGKVRFAPGYDHKTARTES